MKIVEFKDPISGKRGIYLFTSDHLERCLLFRSEEDYVFGVNTLALGTLRFKVKVLCYALMGNHIHLLLMGRYEECRAFYAWVLHRLAQRVAERYGLSGILKFQASDVQNITDRDMLLNEVCYLLRNAYKARIDSPFSYRWAPFECYFNPYLPYMHGDPVPSGRRVRELFGTHVRIPVGWEHLRGCILNKCFVDYVTVEQMVERGSLGLFDRLRKYDLETVVSLSHGIEESITFTDTEMLEKLRTICRNEFHAESLHQLDRKTLLLLARTLARRFACPQKQISRLLGIDSSVLDNLL
ncbi:MAG: hypothetical protein II874_06405 [Bacteroidales bacterium]|nr:hypothetical protein [Bacteroidales bacterium]